MWRSNGDIAALRRDSSTLGASTLIPMRQWAAEGPIAPRWAIPPIAGFATLLGLCVSAGEWWLVGVGVAVIAILVGTMATNTTLALFLTFAALVQSPIGSIGGVPNLMLAELLVPLLMIVLVLRPFISYRVKATTAQPSPARAINWAIGMYALVIVLNYLRTKYLLDSTVSKGSNHDFYDYSVALGAYLIFYLLFTSPGFDWSRLLRFLFYISLAGAVIGLGAILLHIPLNFGSLRYSTFDYTSGAVRIGFLEPVGIIGLGLVFTTKVRYRLPLGLLFAGALVASGGRAAAVGAAVAIVLYLVITRRSWQVLVTAASVGLLAIAVPSLGSSPQIERLARLNSHELSRDGRTYLYDTSLRAFASHPLVGTGVGVPTHVIASPEPIVNRFYEEQLEEGGHATYTSLLKNFGLVGFLPFVFALLLALRRLIPRGRVDSVAAFFFIMLTAEAVSIFASGNGSDPTYFFALAGASASLTADDTRLSGVFVRRRSRQNQSARSVRLSLGQTPRTG
jgi:O-antigen ligase